MQERKGGIQDFNARIAQLNSQTVELVEERTAISGKGECQVAMPMAADDDGHRNMLPWFLVVTVRITHVAVVTVAIEVTMTTNF